MRPDPSPTQRQARPENRFLAALEPDEATEVRALLKRVLVKVDDVVVQQGAPVGDVYFPIDAQFANLIRFSDASVVETSVVGNEGLTGLAPFMACRPSAWEIVCRATGEAWVARAGALRALAVSRPALMARLLALTDLYQAQAAQTAACNALHSIPERVARWILTARDLSPCEPLVFRQDELARLIGARRSTVSEAASELKRRRLITYGRGVIRVIDHTGLEAMACDCYRMMRPRIEQQQRSPEILTPHTQRRIDDIGTASPGPALISLNQRRSPMADKTLDTLFHDTLKDIYYAERKILKSLPKMARAAQSPELKAAFEAHKGQTEGQIERLQKVFEIIGKPARGKTCDAIEGILAEGEEIAEAYEGTAALDAGLLAAAQAVEHYEITRYGTLKRWALVLGLDEAAALLDETLQEESQTDLDLTGIADATVNADALKAAA